VNKMITIKGKYNQANVMIDTIDETTREQIQNFVNNASFKQSYIAIMPDCHAGAGSCIGFTMPLNERIIPNVVGVDIGCGLLSYKFDIESFNVSEFDTFIKENIPSGFSLNSEIQYKASFYYDTVEKLGLNSDKISRALGTLGGGNHFIEAGFGQDKKLWVTVHSGSRNFGLQIAKYHSNIAKDLCEKWGADTQGIPFLLTDSIEGKNYIEDQYIGVRYAHLNRVIIMEKIQQFFKKPYIDCIESIHNFISATDKIIRKGATSAYLWERLIIPFNMRDGLAICVGKGNKKYNYSAPHGAGRILSRSKAKKELNVEDFITGMKDSGVYTTTANQSTLDEAPNAYKDKAIILENIKETVNVLEFVKPVYNFKASEEKNGN